MTKLFELKTPQWQSWTTVPLSDRGALRRMPGDLSGSYPMCAQDSSATIIGVHVVLCPATTMLKCYRKKRPQMQDLKLSFVIYWDSVCRKEEGSHQVATWWPSYLFLNNQKYGLSYIHGCKLRLSPGINCLMASEEGAHLKTQDGERRPHHIQLRKGEWTLRF